MSTPCRYERIHERPCILCRAPQPGTAAPPESDEHLAQAEAADRLAAAELYAERGLYLFSVEVGDLGPHERLVLDVWAAGNMPLGQHFAQRAHVAGPVTHLPAGEGLRPVQACTRCRVVLQNDHALVEDGAYPVGAYVGLDCEGRPLQADTVSQLVVVSSASSSVR